MSILDVFMLVFETDTKNVEKGTDDARKSAKSMADELLKTGETAGAVGGKFMGLVQQAGALAAAYFAVTTYANQIGETVALGRAAETLGDAVEDVDAFGRAAVKAGGDAQGALDSLTDISEKVGEALQDVESGAAKSFTSLGIKLKDTTGHTKGAVAAMLDLAGAVQGMTREEAIFRIKELGVTDNRTVDLLLKGRAALEAMMTAEKAFGVVTKEDAEVATKFKDALASTGGTMGLMVTKINTAVLPAITWTVEAFRGLINFLGEHKTFVIAFFAGVAAIVAYVYVPAMAAAAVTTLAAAAPFLILAAALAALAAAFALAYDDIVTFMEGGDSMIGRLVERFPILGKVVDMIGEAFARMGELGGAAWDLLAPAIEEAGAALESLFGTLADELAPILEVVATLFGGAFAVALPIVKFLAMFIGTILVGAVLGLAKGIEGLAFVAEKVFGNILHFVGWIVTSIKDLLAVIAKATGIASAFGFGDKNDPTMQALAQGQQAITTATATPLASQTSNSIANSSKSTTKSTQVNVTGPITVQTQATDAAGISQGIGGALGDQLQQVNDHYDDGFAY